MDWVKLINERYTTFAWDTVKKVDTQLIKDAMYEAYMHTPTKNLKYPFVIKLIKNNEERSRELMTICHRNQDLPIEEDPGNPQLLAPYLLGFTQRHVKEMEVYYQKTYARTPFGVDLTDHLEIGIQAMFLMYALKNRGLDTGVTQNVNIDPEKAAKIFETERPVRFIMGVGYSRGLGRHLYVDPRTKKQRFIPYAPEDNTKVYPKPNFNDVYMWEDV